MEPEQGREKTLQQAVFDSVYQSPVQLRRRRIAILLLLLKYGLRGLLILWPVYVLIIIGIVYPESGHYLVYLLAFVPGVVLWFFIYIAGARQDYMKMIEGRILDKDYLGKVLSGKLSSE